MAKKNKDIVTRARTRKPAPVKKPFPVGFAIGAVVLTLALGSIITYSAKHQGLGDTSSLTYARAQIDDLKQIDVVSSNHKPGPQSYPDVESVPPTGGDHNVVPQSCQVYDKPIANEHAVHSLEHGAAWLTYDPSLPAKDIATLKKLADGDPYRMMSPYPGLKRKISLQAWGEQVFIDKVSDSRIKRFLELFAGGPQAPERNAACQGTTATGPVAPAPAPAPSASATPTASPTPKK